MSETQPGGPAEGQSAPPGQSAQPGQPGQPGQAAQPGQGHPAQPGQAAQGTIRLTLQGNFMTSGLTPTVHVTGHRVNSRFGTMDVPVWAGRNRVDVHTQWMREYGQASLEVDVPPGGVVPVYYAVPWHQFTRGAIGTEKQSRPGLGAFVLIIGAVVALPLLVVILGALGG